MGRVAGIRNRGQTTFSQEKRKKTWSVPYFLLTQPMSKLRESLLNHFEGQDVFLDYIYKTHSIDTPYVMKNYREVITKLEDDGVVTAYSTKGQRRGQTYPEHVRIRFPKGGAHGN